MRLSSHPQSRFWGPTDTFVAIPPGFGLAFYGAVQDRAAPLTLAELDPFGSRSRLALLCGRRLLCGPRAHRAALRRRVGGLALGQLQEVVEVSAHELDLHRTQKISPVHGLGWVG